MPFPSLPRPGAAMAALIAVPALAAPAPEPTAKTSAIADFSTCAKPVWPKEALRNEQQGTVTLAFLIGEDGAVRESKILRSSGFGLLDTAAGDALGKCRFKPGITDGKPVAAWTMIQYVWKLDPADQPRTYAEKAALAERAERGDTRAQVTLARVYLADAPRNPQRALELLRAAAGAGDVTAMEHLALILAKGTDVPKDLAESTALYAKAAESGSAYSQHMLGRRLAAGEGVPKDEAAAEGWLRKSAAQGYVHAQVSLAALLQHREGTTTPEVVALLKQAAARDNVVAQRQLAWNYEHGTGTPQDYAAAAALYRKASASGDPAAKRGLARLYEAGHGVPADSAAAAMLRQDAALGESARAQATR